MACEDRALLGCVRQCLKVMFFTLLSTFALHFLATSMPPQRQDILHGEEAGIIANTGGWTSLESHKFLLYL